MVMNTASEVNVYERRTRDGRRHYQYDFKVTMPDGSIYRERRKARGATSESSARLIGLRRLHEVLRKGPNPRKTGARLPTVEEFAPMWLEMSRANRHKPSTLHNKEVLLRCHILPLLGARRLDEISALALEEVKHARRHLGPGTVNNLIKYIVALLRCAKLKGYKVEIPDASYLPNEVEAAWYTDEQLELLVRSAATFGITDTVLILLAGDAGLRSGEISALRWEDVDFVQREINVRHNLVRGHEGTPKGGRSRKVPMSRRLFAALVAHRVSGDRRVLQREDGSAMTINSQRRALERVARYAGVPEYGMHALRHCFGSRLSNNGSGGKVIMQLLGHAKLQSTEKYIHASPENCRLAVERLA